MIEYLDKYVAHIDRDGFDESTLYSVVELSNMGLPSVGVKVGSATYKLLLTNKNDISIYERKHIDVYGVPIYEGSYLMIPDDREKRVYIAVKSNGSEGLYAKSVDGDNSLYMGSGHSVYFICVGHEKTNPEIGG